MLFSAFPQPGLSAAPLLEMSKASLRKHTRLMK